MDIKGLIIDSFGLEMNLRQLNDGSWTERYAWKGDRKYVTKKVSYISACR